MISGERERERRLWQYVSRSANVGYLFDSVIKISLWFRVFDVGFNKEIGLMKKKTLGSFKA